MTWITFSTNMLMGSDINFKSSGVAPTSEFKKESYEYCAIPTTVPTGEPHKPGSLSCPHRANAAREGARDNKCAKRERFGTPRNHFSQAISLIGAGGSSSFCSIAPSFVFFASSAFNSAPTSVANPVQYSHTINAMPAPRVP